MNKIGRDGFIQILYNERTRFEDEYIKCGGEFPKSEYEALAIYCKKRINLLNYMIGCWEDYADTHDLF